VLSLGMRDRERERERERERCYTYALEQAHGRGWQRYALTPVDVSLDNSIVEIHTVLLLKWKLGTFEG